MHRAARLPTRLAHALFPALLAGVLGTAAQLQQGRLWGGWEYGGMVLFALSLCALVATKNIAIAVRLGGVVLAAAALGFGMTGLRSVVYGASALEPALEGRDLVVTGIVANLPQRNETGLRFRLKVESALLNGVPTPVPPRMDVAWYGGAFVAGPAFKPSPMCVLRPKTRCRCVWRKPGRTRWTWHARWCGSVFLAR